MSNFIAWIGSPVDVVFFHFLIFSSLPLISHWRIDSPCLAVSHCPAVVHILSSSSVTIIIIIIVLYDFMDGSELAYVHCSFCMNGFDVCFGLWKFNVDKCIIRMTYWKRRFIRQLFDMINQQICQWYLSWPEWRASLSIAHVYIKSPSFTYSCRWTSWTWIELTDSPDSLHCYSIAHRKRRPLACDRIAAIVCVCVFWCPMSV